VTAIYGTGAPDGGIWVPYDGIGAATNAADGYLQITDAVNSQRGVVVFPDFDNGQIVQGFTFDCWVRIGNSYDTSNPADTTPADGFSIAFARAGDPVLTTGDGFAEGPDSETDMPEEGTTTGISVGFDAYANGGSPPWPPDQLTNIFGDIVGIDVRVEGILILQYPMPTLNGSVTDPTSIQTGANDGTASPDSLSWAHLQVSLSTNGLLNVYYKGAQILTNYATGYVPGPGQLVLAGRTGGYNENQDVDNITITTTLAQNVVAGTTATGLGDGVSVPFYDSGAGVVDPTKPATVSIDGAPAVPASVVVKQGTTTSVIYYGYPTLFVPGSQHTVVATVTDVFDRVVTSARLSFTVGAYSTVNSALAVTGVDTTTEGFHIKPWQGGIEPNDYWWADEQLEGLHGFNPICELPSTNNGYFDYRGVINFSYTNTAGVMDNEGFFQANNGYPDSQLPGIVTDPNTSGTPANTNVDNCALEVLCFLHFQNPGVYEMGVNSDDGFDLTVGTNPEDWGSLSLGSFLGGRGQGTPTLFSFVIPAAGYYPFRLVWENGTGGANLEWFVVQPGGTYILVNDPSPTNTTGITAYYGGPTLPAYVSDLIPWPNSTTYAANQFSARLTDLGTTVTAGSLALSLDGAPISAVFSNNAGVTTVSAPSGFLLPVGAHTAQLVYSTSGRGPFTNTWNFTVTSYLISSWAVPASSVDTTKPGFRIRPFQNSYGNTSAWPNGAPYGLQPNSVQYTLEQLSGLLGASDADLSTATDAGYIDYTNLINFNLDPSGGQIGDFQSPSYPDSPFPGLLLTTAGGTVPDTGNESLDILAFVQFATAGTYTMGVNSDDGFAVFAGANPSDWSTAALLGSYNTGRGSADTTFSFLVITPGIYPFRMIYENGNGSFAGGNGGNCEWFMVNPDGTKILINDPKAPEPTGVAAFFKGPALPAYVSALCPADGATGVSPVCPGAGLSPNAFGVQLTDGSTTVTPGSIMVAINGTAMTPTVAKNNGVTTVTLPGFLPVGTNTAQFVYSTSGGGPFTNTWGFTVAANTTPVVNGAWAVTGVNTADKGFKYRPWNSGEGNAQPNTVWWTEEQLAGLHGANNADLSILDDGNYYDYKGIVNFDIGSGDGDFTAANGYPDIAFPGLPGANGTTDNSSFEILTFLQFKQVGVYTMCVNSDDGFKVTVGPNPADWFALNLGQYNGGRGYTFDGGTTFSFIITNAGFYPFRLIYENGTGGMNCEWDIVQPNGDRILINDPAAPENTQVTAYYSGPAAAAGVTKVEPTPGGTDGLGSLVGTLADGSTPVVQSSIRLDINGVAVTPTLVYANGITTVTYDLLTATNNTATLVYSTSTGGPFTNTWSFTTTVAPDGGVVLSTNLWTPPGSGSNPGFALKVFQTANTNIFNGYQTLSRMADMAIQGLYGPNLADLTEFTNNGALWWSNGVINFSSNDPLPVTPPPEGNFEATAYPDAFFPGLGYTYAPTNYTLPYGTMNDVAMEVKAFLEFPSAGYYEMGVNSDDGFRVTVGDQGSPGKSPLSVLAPAGVAGEITAMYPTTADLSGATEFGGNPPSTTPIIGRVVLANPIDASTALVNASALAGNIALIQRGTVTFVVKAEAAQAAGAVAVIIANNAANDTTANAYAGIMGGSDTITTIPCLWVNYDDGTNLISNATTDTSSPLIARITAQDCSAILGSYDSTGGRGSSDSIFGVTVPKAGVYPFRLIWDNGGGGCNCEWFIRDLVLGDFLVNEPASPVKAWITRNVNYAGALPAPKVNNPTLSAGNVLISWTGEGELWESYSLAGPWFKSTYQANPSAVVPSPFLKTRFFRVRQY
jgi:hypothetical protein